MRAIVIQLSYEYPMMFRGMFHHNNQPQPTGQEHDPQGQGGHEQVQLWQLLTAHLVGTGHLDHGSGLVAWFN